MLATLSYTWAKRRKRPGPGKVAPVGIPCVRPQSDMMCYMLDRCDLGSGSRQTSYIPAWHGGSWIFILPNITIGKLTTMFRITGMIYYCYVVSNHGCLPSCVGY